MVFVPLIFGILQNDDLSRRQQRLDLDDGRVAVGLEAGPGLLQLLRVCAFAGHSGTAFNLRLTCSDVKAAIMIN
jgi:hypothetical protein